MKTIDNAEQQAADYVDLDAFIRFAMPDDFANLFGALFTVGFNYSVENRLVDGNPQLTLRGFRVNEDGEQKDARHVVAIWTYRGGEWEFSPESGLHRLLKSTGATKIEARTCEQLVDYVGERVNEWDLKPIEDVEESEATDEEVIDDGYEEEPIEDGEVDQDLLDKLQDSINKATGEADDAEPEEVSEQPAIEAAKSA